MPAISYTHSKCASLFFVPAVVVACGMTGGCRLMAARFARSALEADLRVSRVSIQPFTKPASFDDDNIPDGISAWVQAHDAFGDPVKIVGDLVFELYTLRNASSERKGERLITWNHTIRTRNDQITFWDRPSQTYQFELAWNTPPASGDAFVLAVTLTTPDDLHFADEYDIHVNVNALRSDITGR